MRALIDGDILRYRIGFACEKPVWRIYEAPYVGAYDYVASFTKKEDAEYWVGEHKDDFEIVKETEPDSIENCLHSLKLQLNYILERIKAHDYKIYLSKRPCFREDVAKTRPYKGNRPDRKPYHYDNITKYLIDYCGAEEVEFLEADDALAIHQSEALCQGHTDETIICTIDKDLDQVPGHHFDFVKDKKYYVTSDEANLNLYIQVLTGDSTDNIVGIPKVGPVGAMAVLGHTDYAEVLEAKARKRYLEHFKDEEIANEKYEENFNLVYLLRNQGEKYEWLERLANLNLMGPPTEVTLSARSLLTSQKGG